MELTVCWCTPRREHYLRRTGPNQAYFDTRTAGLPSASIQIRRDSRLTTDVTFVPESIGLIVGPRNLLASLVARETRKRFNFRGG